VTCKRCGDCCKNNGFIPPVVPGEDVPEWLALLVAALRERCGAVAEDWPCIFLTHDLRCAIHDLAKPEVCREFECEAVFAFPQTTM